MEQRAILPVEDESEDIQPDPEPQAEPAEDRGGALEQLEARILQAVAAVKAARQAKAAAEAEAEQLREKLTAREADAARLERELQTVRNDRKTIGDRIEALLEQVDEL